MNPYRTLCRHCGSQLYVKSFVLSETGERFTVWNEVCSDGFEVTVGRRTPRSYSTENELVKCEECDHIEPLSSLENEFAEQADGHQYETCAALVAPASEPGGYHFDPVHRTSW